MHETIIKSLEKHGRFAQTLKAIEELAELQQALSKFLLGEEHNVEEEIADVIIMLEYLKILFNNDEVDSWKDAKIERLKNKLK